MRRVYFRVMSLRVVVAVACAAGLVVTAPARPAAQTRRTQRAQPTRRQAPPAPPVREAALLVCPNALGEGALTKKSYCDVLTALDASEGARIPIPPHRGEATIFFDLHNRQTYSDEQVKAGRAYARYTATVRILSDAGQELGQALIQSEFRTERDLVERILGGAGPGGLKAVAPTGTESIVVTVPEAVSEVVLVGQRLVVESLDRREQFGAPGRPIATVSSVMVEYRPAPPKPVAPTKPPTPAKPRR